MDPYLELAAFWRGVHTCLIAYICAALQPVLRPKYNARIEERLSLSTGRVGAAPAAIDADVNIASRGLHETPTRMYDWVAPVDAGQDRPLTRPWIVAYDDDPPPERYIEIINTTSREVVTVIELLSPTNKTGQGTEEYRRKHIELLHSRANLVEIDMLSQGIQPFPRPEACDAAACRYVIGVSRASDRSQYVLYPFSLGDMLPKFAMPLSPPDADVALDLQRVFNQCYLDGAYDDLIDYTRAPDVPLTEAEQSSVASILAKYAEKVHSASAG